MREIKFRAWDKECKEMITDANSDIKMYLNGALSLNGEWVTSDLIIMQFTGLQDSKGTEIYELDILKPIDSEVSRAVVEWDKNMWVRRWLSVDGGEEFNFPLQNTEEFEVIGNVYQHQELLEIKSK